MRDAGPVGPHPPRLLDRVREASRLIYTHVLNRGPAGVTSPADRVLDL